MASNVAFWGRDRQLIPRCSAVDIGLALMKLILATDDQEQFAAAWDLLHEQGIPAYEPAKYSDMPGYRVGPNVRSLYIWLDHQFEDAVRLLKDPNHIVKNPVNLEEFERTQERVGAEFQEAREKVHERLMNVAIGAVLLAFIGFGAYRIWLAH